MLLLDSLCLYLLTSVIDLLLAFLGSDAKRAPLRRLIPVDISRADTQALLLVVLLRVVLRHGKEGSGLLFVHDFSHEGQIVA